MSCEQTERQLGRYIDTELSAAQRSDIDTHLKSCSHCRAAFEELCELANKIAQPASARVPASLWTSIEQRLDQTKWSPPPARTTRHLRIWSAPWAIAAGVVLTVGLGMLGLSSLDTTAQASTVDFGVLLDALPLDAQKAFRKFLVRYDAKPTTPIAAKRIASNLNFDTPAVLPGGFRLESVYELRIGRTNGIAAAYERNGELLAVVFHEPMKHEKFGSHESYPCVIGKHCGHKVQVGNWKLVHLTDRTTCHCLLSRLDEKTEMPEVMAAIAPKPFKTEAPKTHRHP